MNRDRYQQSAQWKAPQQTVDSWQRTLPPTNLSSTPREGPNSSQTRRRVQWIHERVIDPYYKLHSAAATSVANNAATLPTITLRWYGSACRSSKRSRYTTSTTSTAPRDKIGNCRTNQRWARITSVYVLSEAGMNAGSTAPIKPRRTIPTDAHKPTATVQMSGHTAHFASCNTNAKATEIAQQTPASPNSTCTGSSHIYR